MLRCLERTREVGLFRSRRPAGLLTLRHLQRPPQLRVQGLLVVIFPSHGRRRNRWHAALLRVELGEPLQILRGRLQSLNLLRREA